MDQVDRMKLCGLRLNLLGFSSFLSVLGIVFGFMLGIGGLFFLESGASLSLPRDDHFDITRCIFLIIGGVLIILMIPYLIMWILLKIKSSKQNIPGIERIGKVYVSGTLEIIGGIVRILFSCMIQYSNLRIVQITVIIYSALCLIFTCLKIHGTRVKNNKLLGTYLEFDYALFFLNIIAFIISITTTPFLEHMQVTFAAWIVSIVYLILDIGLTLILYSIRENTARTESPIDNL